MVGLVVHELPVAQACTRSAKAAACGSWVTSSTAAPARGRPPRSSSSISRPRWCRGCRSARRRARASARSTARARSSPAGARPSRAGRRGGAAGRRGRGARAAARCAVSASRGVRAATASSRRSARRCRRAADRASDPHSPARPGGSAQRPRQSSAEMSRPSTSTAPLSGVEQRRDQHQQRRLARAARPVQRHELAAPIDSDTPSTARTGSPSPTW